MSSIENKKIRTQCSTSVNFSEDEDKTHNDTLTQSQSENIIHSELNIHNEIKERLKKYIEFGKVPHLIFHGPSGSGKRTIVNWFLNQIYKNTNQSLKDYVMYVDCAHGKGIKFIREQVKFFAKINLQISNDRPFKSIVLSNADKLTTDAQSALRRLIEVFSHNTRFFVIVEDKYSMLLPILSRLGDVYIPLPTINGNETNLNKYKIENSIVSHTTCQENENEQFTNLKDLLKTKNRKIGSIVKKHFGQGANQTKTLLTTMSIANECYQNAITVDEVITYLNYVMDTKYKSKYLMLFDKIKRQYRCETLIITTILYYSLVVRSIDNIDNLGFM